MVRKHLISLGLGLGLIALLLWATDQTTVFYEANLNLSSTARQRGDILIFSGNVHVPAGAQLDGSLLVLCCNVHLEGSVQGDVEVTTGNLLIGPQAILGGAILTAATNVQIEPTAIVEGRRVSAGFWPSFGRTVILPPVLGLLGLIMVSSGLIRVLRRKARARQVPIEQAIP